MDFSRHYTGIVIGVACAAIFAILSIITFSHTRRRLQERRHGSLTNSSRRRVSFSDNDIFQQNAPPTYDDGRFFVLTSTYIHSVKKKVFFNYLCKGSVHIWCSGTGTNGASFRC